MRLRLLLLLFSILASHTAHAAGLTAADIVTASIDNWRGLSSYSEFSMTIHRPAWERSMRMQAWTEGDEMSLVRVTEPSKDAGNGTLLIDKQMWSYTPRINRVIKIPSSMMNQSWMGSDFSNKDISRADDIIDLYDHTLLDTTEQDGKTVYTIESIPHEEAAVVWGKEILKIRDDYVLLSQDFIDQDGVLLKSMVTHEIRTIDGRPVATRQRMSKAAADDEDEWTEIIVHTADFDVAMPQYMFTLSNLRNPR
jgi:outer membrane lipoprotein-sorting protein